MTLAGAFVTSFFILPYASAISGSVWLRILGGIHFTCVAVVGLTTILNYFRAKIESFAKVAHAALARLSEADTQRRYIILRQRVEAAPEPDTSGAK
jgi:hypothetical protein